MKLRFLILVVFTIIAKWSFAQSTCVPTVEVTPASCQGVNDGKIVVTPPSTCVGEACFSGPATPIDNCNSCTRSVSGSNGVNINSGEKVCIQAGSNLSGNLTFNGNGTLIVCGTANFQNINLNGSGNRRIVIIGSMTISSMNMGGIEIHNYGTFNITQGLSVEGLFNNYGTVSVNSHFNINASFNGRMYNYGALNVGTQMNDFNIFENRGSVSVGGNLTLNSPTAMYNSCQITVGQDFIINSGSNLNQRGIITVGNYLRLNSNSTIFMLGSTRITAGKMEAGGTLLQHNGGSGCSLLRINGVSNLNQPITFSGHLSFCPNGGFQSSTRPTYINGAQESCTTCNPPATPPSGAVVTWTDFGTTGPELNNVGPGAYGMELTCGACTYTNSYTVTASGGVSVTISLGTDGQSLTANVSGDPTDYNFEWSSSTGVDLPNEQIITGLSPGTYTVKVTDSNGCSDTKTYTINSQSCNPTYTQTPISCFGANDASITVDDLGCADGEVFWLDLGIVGNTISNLGPQGNVFAARISCGNSCVDTLYFTIEGPDELQLISDTDESGLIALTATGGTGPYTFVWTDMDGNNFLQPNSLGLTPGDYEVKVTDGNGCEDSFSVTVTTPTCLDPKVTVTSVNCNVTNGKIEIASNSICESAFITWSNSSDEIIGSGLVLQASAGVYTLNILCEACSFSKTFEIVEVAPLTISAFPVGNGANLLVTGGTAPMTYQWVNNGMIVSTEKSPVQLPAGINTVLVIDANGCSAETTVTVNTPACDPQVEITNVTCNGDNDGSIEITDPGCDDDEDDNNACEVFYELRAKGVMGSEQVNFRVNELTIATFTLSKTMNTYAISSYLTGPIDVQYFNDDGASRDVRIDYIKVNGTTLQAEAQSTNTAAWNNNSGSCGAPNSEWMHCNGIIGFGSTPNCENDDENPGCVPPSSPKPQQQCNSCTQTYQGNNLNINVNSSSDKICITSGTVSNLTFNAAGTVIICGDATLSNVNLNTAGTIVVLGNAQFNGINFNSSNAQIFNYGRMVFSSNMDINGKCYNHGTLTVAHTLNINDATGSLFNYGTVTITRSLNNSEVLENYGTITVGTDPNVDKIHLNGGSNTINACTMSVVGELLIDAGSTLEYRSNIQVGTKLTLNGSSNLKLFGGTKIQVQDFHGNSSVLQVPGSDCSLISVSRESSLQNMSIDGMISYCDLNGIEISSNVQLLNGAGFNCSCVPGASSGTQLAVITWPTISQTGPIATGLGPGKYPVSISCESCYSVHEYEVTAPPALVVSATVSESSGQVTLVASGGTPFDGGHPYPYDYEWNSDNGEAIPNIPDPILPAPGIYTVTITDSKGCTTSTIVEYDVPECSGSKPTVDLKHETCFDSNDGAITILNVDCPSGTSGSISYIWSGPGISSETGSGITGLSPGMYDLVINCSGECFIDATFEVKTLPNLNIDAVVVESPVSCDQAFDGALYAEVSGGSGEYTYTWEDAWKVVGITSDITDLVPGVYTITVADLANSSCTAEREITLSEPGIECDCETFAVDITGQGPTCGGGSDGYLEAVVSGDTGPYTFRWNTIPQQTTARIENLSAGIYSVEVKDGAGNTCYKKATLKQPNSIEVDIILDGEPELCMSSEVPEVILLEARSASRVTYTWTPGNSTDRVLVVNQPGTYTVVATQGNCSGSASVTIIEDSDCEDGGDPNCDTPLQLELIPTDLTCAGAGDGKGEVIVSGGSDDYAFAWSNGSSLRVMRNVEAGAYTVTVTDRTNPSCRASGILTINEPNPMTVVIQGDPFVCQQGSTVLSAVGSIGNYTWFRQGRVMLETTQTIAVTTGGTFIVEVRDGLCMARSPEFSVDQQPDDIAIYSSKTKICPGQTVTLTSSYPDNLIWSTGETTQQITVSETGTYTVSVQLGDCEAVQENFDITAKSADECAPPDLCEPQFGIPVTVGDPCVQDALDRASQNARVRYEEYIDAQRKDFQQRYVAQCIKAQEEFTIQYEEKEHHYTLFYYDQAGNLVRTVPPQGVVIINDQTTLNQVANERIANERTIETAHDYLTTYRFNSNNQSVRMLMPDQDPFPGQRMSQRQWYDELGRMVLSQTSFQYDQNPRRYQYVLFDSLGRVMENGEVRSNVDIATIENTDFIGRVNSIPFSAWIQGETKYEVSRNYYEIPHFSIPNFFQENLRNRLSSTTYEVADSDNDPATYDNAIHYSYDIHGNVKTQVNDNPPLEHLASRYKTIKYIYDQISSNVIEMHYQPNSVDQFYHRYEYDADNRLVQTWTSRDYIHWDCEAKHFFYDHGPLARTELGHEKVQGMDYAYTIQGWNKGVNSNTLIANRDMGKDGDDSGFHQYIPQDEMGYSLGFYHGDYSPIGSFNNSNSFLINIENSELETVNRDLYNGNITHMITSIKQFMKDGQGPLAQSFRYDQLHRLKESRVYEDPNSTNTNNWSSSGTATDKYLMKLTYDANGNIMTLKRNAHTSTTSEGDGLDDLVYYYENKANGYGRNTNRLIAVEDNRDHSGDEELDKIDDIRPGQQHD